MLLPQKFVFVAIGAAVVAFDVLACNGTHPFTANDLVSIPRIGSPALSPDGKFAILSQYQYDLDSSTAATNLVLVNLVTDDTRALTIAQPGVTDSNAVWIDSVTVLFTSNRKPSGAQLRSHAFGGEDGASPVQIWQLSIARDAEPIMVTKFAHVVSNLKYNEASKLLAFSARVADVEDHAVPLAHESLQETAVAYESLMFRHWDTFNDGKRNVIFVASVSKSDDGYVSLGKERNILQGMKGIESPVPPFGGADDFSFSPEGREMAFLAKPPLKKDEAWSTDTKIWIVSTESAEWEGEISVPVTLTKKNRGACSRPVYSPDGRWLAWLQMEVPGYESDRRRIVLYDRQASLEKRHQYLLSRWDRSPTSILFSPDSSEIYMSVPDVGKEKIFVVPVMPEPAKPHLRELTTRGTAGDIQFTPDASSPASAGAHILVYIHHDLKSPPELFTMQFGAGEGRRRTFITREHMDAIQGLAEPQEFWFTGAAKGQNIHGWVLEPNTPYVDKGKKLPVAFLIHGGPQSAWMDSWSTRWNPQIFAAAGYITIAINPTGSTSYGQKLTDDIAMNWGGTPYEDLMIGLDRAIEKFPIDQDRMCALGASYGGYMVNWIQGHTKRFKCLVNHDGAFSTLDTYYATDELYFPEHEFGGTPWDNPKYYDKWNPANYIKHWTTPALVVHGGKDYRLVDSQGFSTFTVLQRKGVPSRLLYFPNENHWVLSPPNSLRWHREILVWLETYTGSDPGAGASAVSSQPGEHTTTYFNMQVD